MQEHTHKYFKKSHSLPQYIYLLTHIFFYLINLKKLPYLSGKWNVHCTASPEPKTELKFLNGFDHSLNLEKTDPTPTPTRPDRGQTFSQPNHVQSSSNFEDIFLIIHQPDLWCQRLPHPSKSPVRNLNVLQAPNLCILREIMFDLDQTIRLGPIATTNLIYDVKDDLILQVSGQEPSTSSKYPTYTFSAKSWTISIKLLG